MNDLSMIEKIRDENYEISADEMEDWIRTDPDCLSKYHDDPNGQLPLHVVCRNGRPWRNYVVDWMVKRYPNAASVQDNNGNLPLHLSVERLCLLPSRLLDAYPVALETPNNRGELPLHVACSNCLLANLEILPLLLDRYPVACNRKDNDGNLPLHLLCRCPDFIDQRVMQICLDAYPEGLLERNHRDYLPIEYLIIALCITPQGMDALRLLVGRNPECVRSRSTDGRLPLHTACTVHVEYAVVEFLLDQYPEGASVRGSYGMFPLHYFCYTVRGTCELETLQLLIEKSPKALSAADDDGLLPLECFWAKHNSKCVLQEKLKSWEEDAEPFRFLLAQSHQALRVKDRSGKLSLHRLCQSGGKVPLEALQALVDAYPDSAQVLDRMGNLPLFYLCENEEEFGLVDSSEEEEEEEEEESKGNSVSLDAIYYLAKRSLPFVVQRTATSEECVVARKKRRILE